MLDAVEQLDGGSVSGSLFGTRIDWVAAYGDSSDIDAVALALRPFAIAPNFDRAAWLPFRALTAVDAVIVMRFESSGGAQDVMEDIGRFAARMLFPVPFREWSDGDHHRFFDELGTAQRTFLDFATPQYRRAAPKRGYIMSIAAGCYSRLHCASMVGFYEQCLLMRGAMRPVVSEEICRCLGWPMCKFLVSWR